ncbi:hypothetical protein EDD16DRAFT_1693250 [Pisolithus croceorrhizus]|nr:hypothetical protein EV401DRAFT_2061656 [Pisolithus croceorrhizus]KAI6116616.1 hypothetical protein EDD16DRAFT_1693250 [Pisolithus croceorrhizus]KAI6142553.1 hypothetical protein EDD17DRAFT_1781887 [Pisolithus thermaeus]
MGAVGSDSVTYMKPTSSSNSTTPERLGLRRIPLVTNLIDDKSPLILYDSTWIFGKVLLARYYFGTYATSSVPNRTVSFLFNGTGVWLYGAKRNTRNGYTIELDGTTYGPYSAYNANEEFLQVLFSQTSLAQGMHNLSLTYAGINDSSVDIDLIVWQSEVGSDDQELITETIQDTDPRFQYQEAAWSSPPDANFYSNGTGHYTEAYPASATLTFTVCSEMVTLFGATSTSTGPYTVQLDGGNVLKYNGTALLPFYGVTLFHANNLGPGQHSLTITNVPAETGQQLCIDYALVSSLSK